jgi:hypothetical protein
MKTLEFKVWKWFIPVFGLFYIMWYGWITIIKKKYESDIDKLHLIHPLAFYGFIFYGYVHIYGTAFLGALVLSLTGVI